MKRKYWTDKEVEKLIRLYPTTLGADLAKMFECRINVLYDKAYKLGLKKDKEFMAEVFRERMKDPNHGGKKHQFKKVDIPANKGMKQEEYMTPASIDRTKATRFKKGDVPLNTRPIGSERMDADGYTLVKVTDRNWKLKHRLIWEKTYGKIPKGYNIQFKDGNKQNMDISNLYMISRSNQMNENSITRYPSEVITAIKRISKINKLIKNEE